MVQRMRYNETELEYRQRLNIWHWRKILALLLFHAAWISLVIWLTV